jgi:hypothetical protein
MATHHDHFTSTLYNGFASLFKELNIQEHNNNLQGYASSIQMGNQMQYAGQYVGNQMNQNVNQNLLNHNGIDCFITSRQATTSSSDSDLPPTYNSDSFHEVPNYGNNDNLFAHEKLHYVPPEPNYNTYVGEQVNSNVNYETPYMNPNGVQVAQNGANDEETRALFESLLNNYGIEIEKVKKVNRDVKAANVKLTAELESYKKNVKSF